MYQCKKCDYIFEKIEKIDNRNEPISYPCPNCRTLGEVVHYITGRFSSPEKEFRPPKEFGKFLKKLKDNTKESGNFRTD